MQEVPTAQRGTSAGTGEQVLGLLSCRGTSNGQILNWGSSGGAGMRRCEGWGLGSTMQPWDAHGTQLSLPQPFISHQERFPQSLCGVQLWFSSPLSVPQVSCTTSPAASAPLLILSQACISLWLLLAVQPMLLLHFLLINMHSTGIIAEENKYLFLHQCIPI